MANGWTEAKKHNPCPICGTGDYCATHDAEDGIGKVYLCKRYTTPGKVMCPGGDTMGYDGGFYILVGETGNGYGVYRNAVDVQTLESMGVKVYKKNGGPMPDGLPKVNRREDYIPIGITPVAPDAFLDKVYSALISAYPLSKEHREYLKREGWSDELIDSANLATIPVEDWRRGYHKKCECVPACYAKYRATVCKDIVEAVGEPVGVPGFYLEKDKYKGEEYWTFQSRSGIVFPLYNESGQIVRLRVRMDYLDTSKEYQKDTRGMFFVGEDNRKRYVSLKGVFRENFDGTMEPEKDEKYRAKGKYRWLTSFSRVDNDEDKSYTNRYKFGSECGNICGVYSKENYNFLIAIATEGEKKSIMGSDRLNMPFICVPGVSSYDKLFTTRIGKNILEYLEGMGTKYIAIAYDADKWQNQMVLDAEKAFAKKILASGLKACIVNWDVKYGKGLDDAIINGVLADNALNFRVMNNEGELNSYYS